jgi:hypothetical protein
MCVRFTQKPVVTVDRESLQWPLFVPFKMVRVEDGAEMQPDYGRGNFYSRRKTNVIHLSCLTLDIDNDPTKGRPYLSLDDAIQSLNGRTYALYTSYNHQNHDPAYLKGHCDKYRIILPLLEPVQLEDAVERVEALKQLFPSADPASFVPSQPFFVPIAHPNRAHSYRTAEGTGTRFDLLNVEPTRQCVQITKSLSQEWIPTDEVYPDLPTITLADGVTYHAEALWHHLGENQKKACFRYDAPDSKPGCFVVRKGLSLGFFDRSASDKMQWIKIFKSKPPAPLTLNLRPHDPHDDVEVETIPLWTAKPKVALPPLQYDQHVNLIRLNQRFLPDNLYEQILTEGITLIQSPMGTGKTEILNALIDSQPASALLLPHTPTPIIVWEQGAPPTPPPNVSKPPKKSVLMLGHRVFLLRNLADRTHLDYYLDLDDGGLTPSLALCINSLNRVKPGITKPFDTIILDESEQVLQALLSPLLNSDLPTIWKNFIWVIKNAKRIVCLDADLSSNLTLNLIQQIRGEDDDVFGVINDYKIGEGKTTKMYESRMHLLADALDAINHGEKAFIATNSRTFATIVDAIVVMMGKKSLLVTANTNEHTNVCDFIENPTEECKRYDVVIASPTLSTGVSIGVPGTRGHFTKVYGFFSLRPGTFQDVGQGISRERCCDDISVWVQGNIEEPTLLSELDICNNLIAAELGTRKLIHDETPSLSEGERKWAFVAARIKFMVQHWSVNKDEQFCSARKALGYKIEHVLNEPDKKVEGANIYAMFKDCGDDHALDVFNAAEINYDEAVTLTKSKTRTHEENLSLERYRLYAILQTHDWSLETVRKALKQELLWSLSKIRTLHTMSDDERLIEDRADRVKNKHTFTINKHRVKQHVLIDYLCKAADINLDALFAQAQGDEEVEIKKEMLLSIAVAYEKQKNEFNFYFNARIKEPTHEKNLQKVWGATFGEHLSLCLKSKKLGPRNQQEKHYFLDLSKKDLVHRVMQDNVYA